MPKSPVTPAARLFHLFEKWFFRVFLILVVGLAAHVGCLHSVFYLDDANKIVDSAYVAGGQWWAASDNLITNLSYYVTWKLAGFSSVAFHLGNLVLHLTLALCVYWLTPSLLALRGHWSENPKNVAWLAALLFASHPLTSEVTHYARARDHGLVGLFSFLVVGFLLLAWQRNWRWAVAALAALACAAMSKGPGLPQAIVNGLIVALAAFSWRSVRQLSSGRTNYLALAGLCLVASAWLFFPLFQNLFTILSNQLGTERFAFHTLTQFRVLPEYLWRMVLPLHLCSDHLVAWTHSFSDKTAWTCGVGLVASLIFLAWLWWKGKQPWALLISLALAPLLLRFLLVVSELMVEYRSYPSMPFVAILLALILMKWHARQPRLAVLGIGVVLVAFTTLTHIRSKDWSSQEALYAQILDEYPLQLRAFNGRSTADLEAGRYESILNRYPEFLKRLNEIFAFNRDQKSRYYENWSLYVVLEECMVAEALAHTRGHLTAQTHHEATCDRMKQQDITHPLLWAQWSYTAGNIAALASDNRKALYYYQKARLAAPSVVKLDKDILRITNLLSN